MDELIGLSPGMERYACLQGEFDDKLSMASVGRISREQGCLGCLRVERISRDVLQRWRLPLNKVAR